MKRKPLAASKPNRPREPRRVTVPFERHKGLPSAIVRGEFVAPVSSRVYAWRQRSGQRPSWHTCTVMKVEAPHHVELWDETLGQWYCLNPAAEPEVPDIRMELLPGANAAASVVPSPTQGSEG